MNPYILATKVMQKASREKNRLILDNCSLEDLVILVKDAGPFKSIVAATNSINSMMRIVVGFREVQARKNAA